MSFNHNDADQKGDSYYSSTSGSRGHKRPRNPRKHLATCNNTSPAALSINCECDKLAQDQKQTNGLYIISIDFALIPLYSTNSLDLLKKVVNNQYFQDITRVSQMISTYHYPSV